MEGERSFGDRLKEYRLSRKLSQEEMAKKLGTSKQVISRYEKNQRTPKISVTTEYARILGISLSWLIGKGSSMYIEGMDVFEDVLTYHWSWPLIEAYCKADLSTQKAACAVLGIEYVSDHQDGKERLWFEKSVSDMVDVLQPENDWNDDDDNPY